MITKARHLSVLKDNAPQTPPMGITGKENHCASVWGYTPANRIRQPVLRRRHSRLASA